MGGMGVWLYLFLTLAIVGGEWLVSFIPQLLYPKYPLSRKLDGCHRWSGHLGEEKNLFPCQESNHNSLVIRPIN
jgi:hypothetical protein